MTNMKLRKYKKIAKKIMELAPKYQEMSDEELKQQTYRLKKRLGKGESIHKVLLDAFAVVIEADARLLGMRPYFVQILGGVSLFYGTIAEMKTGEGKTLTATMPLYLRGLMGKGNYLITANSYLAWRDAQEVGKVFEWLGLSISVGVPQEHTEEEIDKKVVYESDIIYTTHSSLGFDYLFSNLTTELDEQYVKTFNFVLIDEVDAILLDMAQTPLIVSGASKVQSNLFETCDWFVKSIKRNKDYQLSEDQRNVWLTEQGIKEVESFFGIEKILDEEWKDLYRHIVTALKANYIMTNNRDYVVDQEEVFLLDEVNGRKLIGTKLQAGLHQALEAKEDVEITKETKALGMITYQNLFKKFKVLSGMTGTAKTDAEEFMNTYKVEVLEIPTNEPVIRKDHKDRIFATNKSKIIASLERVQKAMNIGRPVLIETGSVSMSDLYSRILLEQKIPHNLLNATSAAKEKWIISKAGEKGAVTVATSMAGRGTDIKLSKEAKDLGGLLVVGTEKMTSQRIDNQLRGRAGRQGDPGDSVFYISLEDRIIVESAPRWVSTERKKIKKLNENHEISHKRKYRSVIFKAQNNRKKQEVLGRENTLEYDEIVNVQREKVYETRNLILKASLEELSAMIDESTQRAMTLAIDSGILLSQEQTLDFIYNSIDYNFDSERMESVGKESKKQTIEFLKHVILEREQSQTERFTNDFQLTYFKRIILLKAVDSMWGEQAETLQQLKSVVASRSWGQHRPIYEFQTEARKSFLEMKHAIWQQTLKNYLLSTFNENEDGTIDLEFP
ncbi:accessory Sec system translocase SecA2 [Enterococcus sp. LJL98]